LNQFRHAPLLPAQKHSRRLKRELSHQVHHHLREEEKKFFQVSGKVLGAAQKARSAKGYVRDYARMRRKLAAQ